MTTETNEEQAMEQVVGRLMEQYPGVTRERVDAIVDEEHHLYDGRPVRDFVPVLVERAVRHRLVEEGAVAARAPEVDGGAAPARREPREIDPMEREREKDRHAGFLFGDLGGGDS